VFRVEYQPEAAAELNRLRAFDRVRILDAIKRHLTAAPGIMGGRKKRLDLGSGNVIHQLRVGDYRIFYDVDAAERQVIVRHVRRKGQRTTGEIL
jgi:mRNA-degrading endonuclease RelE of RelBE toxin-antitoxin system